MFDHLLGRPPGPGYRRTQVLLIICFWFWRAFYGRPIGSRLRFMRKANNILKRLTPWQMIVSTLTLVFSLSQWDVLFGLSAPEPLARLYSRSYYRAAWIATGLDAGFATAMAIKPKWLRDLSSIIFSIYYILNSSQAEEKLRKFRAVCTVELLRATWNKTSNPYIRAISFWDRPQLPLVKKIALNRPLDSSYTRPISTWLFYSRSERELKFATELILDFPGGGFITMGPQHHEERLRRWALQTGRPVLAIDYSKAPEYPYPYAIDECFDVYRLLSRTKGHIIGMSGQRLGIIMSGDSAGANISANVMFKILETPASAPLPHPIAMVFNYAALDFGFSSWMSPAHLSILRAEHQQSSSHIAGLAEQKDHFAHRSPLSVVSDLDLKALKRPRSIQRRQSWTESFGLFPSMDVSANHSTNPPGSPAKKKKRSLLFRAKTATPATLKEDVESGAVADNEDEDMEQSGSLLRNMNEHEKPLRARVQIPPIPQSDSSLPTRRPFETRLTMTSRVGYFQDKIISPSMMRAMAILYIGPHQNPNFETDYHLSPILASNEFLAKFPPVLLMCGEKDPFVDDSVIFAGRIREAKRIRRMELQQRRGAQTGSSIRTAARHGSPSADDKLLQEFEDDWVQLEVIEGWSHGYLQMTALMPEARKAIEHIGSWIEERFVNSRPQSGAVGSVGDPYLSDMDVTASSETEMEEPLTFATKPRSQSPHTYSSRREPAGGAACLDILHAQVLTLSTPGMVNVKEVDLMKRRRLDAVLGMEASVNLVERR